MRISAVARGSIRRHAALPRCSRTRRRKAYAFAFFADMPRLFQKVGLHCVQTKHPLKQHADETSRRSLRDFDSDHDHLCDVRWMAACARG